MKLPEILQAGRLADHLKGLGRAAFLRSVVHDGHPRPQPVNQGRRVRAVHPMVVDQVYAHGADGVVGADQVQFLVPGEVGQIGEAELAVAEQKPYRAPVLGGVLGLAFHARAGGIRRPGALQRRRDPLAARGHHVYVHAADRNPVARFDRKPLPLPQHLLVSLRQSGRALAGFRIRPVVHEVNYGHLLGQRRHASDVIEVVMSDQHVVDPLDPGQLCGGLNPGGVATVEPRPARVHQHRLAGWGDNQGGLATLDIDEVDLQVAGGDPRGQKR